MRVKEAGTNDLEMGKKKKNKKVPEHHNTSDEETQKKGCSHRDSSFTFQGVKKGLKNTSTPLGTCTSCQSATKKAAAPVEDDSDDSPFEPTVWLCLQCGHQGCDRQSRDKHAVTHYETPRSQSHALALSLATWQVWCYKCDDEVPSADWKKLTECADWLKKQMGLSKSERSSSVFPKKKNKDKDGEKDEGTGKNKTALTMGDKNSSKVKGLVNLGNTCFFNAVMQSLTQTHVLRSVLSEKWSPGKVVDIPLDTNLDLGQNSEETDDDTQEENATHLPVTLPSMGTLTSALLGFLEDMNKETKNSTVNPRPLFSEVCQKAARFKGYQQQDSHELLRYLLDSMKSEQIKRMQEGILHAYNIKDKDKSKVNKLDEYTKKKIRDYGLKSKMTFVDSLFGGYLISSVKCQVCNTVSEILEPFLDLSLSILEAKGSKKFALGGKNPDRPQTLADQAKLAEPESDDLPSPGAGAAAPPKMSKHQQQKAQEQARKLSRSKKKKRSRSLSQSSVKSSDVKGSGSASEHEDGPDPNDADSETSMMDRGTANQNGACTPTEESCELAKTAIGSPTAEMKGEAAPADSEESGSAKLKGGANQDHSGQLTVVGHSSVDTGGRTETVNGDDVSRETEITELRRDLTALDLNSTPSEEKNQGNGLIGGQRQDEQTDPNVAKRTETGPEQLRKGTPKNVPDGEDAREDGDSTPTNSLSPAVTKKRKPPPLIQPPPAPMTHVRSTSPPHSPLSPLIKAKATSPLGPRYHPKSQECSVQSCLSQFTSPEWLTGANKFGCEHCTAKAKPKDADGKGKTQYTDASKQLLIQHPPPILTLHLKRFQQVGFSLRKITRHIDFPLVLDLSPFCSESCQKFANKDGQVLYALYGIVEHSGRLQFGHYTSFIKVRQPSQTLYSHALGIPRSLNLLQASVASSKKLQSAEKKRHHSKNSLPSSASEGQPPHPQHNGVLPTSEHRGETDHTATSPQNNNTSGHNGYIPENNESGQCPLASGGKDANPKGKWYYVSDTHVSEASESKVLNAQAYLLFYERIL